MRWVVEVSSLGKTDLQKFCVEAESWQRALQAARAQRGEEGPMSGFSIELLEEGYRAVDPVARVRFVVKRAPDDMPVTTPVAKDTKGVAPSPPSVAPAAVASAPATEPHIPPAPASSAAATSAAKSVPPRPLTSGANGPASKKGLTLDTNDAARSAPPSATGAPASKAPPATAAASPAIATAPAATAAASPAIATAPAAIATASPAIATAPAATAAATTTASSPAAIGSPLPGLPAVKLLSSREQNPTDASPLTYREYSFAVPAGTSEDVAVQVLRGQLGLVDAHLSTAKMGKLVNLAVFDVEFTGKPPSPPIATLSWKDWKGDPVIGYPRRGGAQKQVKPPSSTGNGPASTAAPASSVFPPPSSMPPPRPSAPPAAQIVAASAPPAPQAVAASAPPAAQTVAASAPPAPQAVAAPAPSAGPSAAPGPFSASPSSIPPANAFSSTAPMIPQALLPQQPPAASFPPPTHASAPPPAHASAAPQAHASVPPQAHASVPPPAHASVPPPAHASVPPPMTSPSQPPVGAGGIPVPVVAPVAVFQPGSIPPPGPAGGSVPPPAPAVAASASQPPPARRPSSPDGLAARADGLVRTPSGRFVRGRTTGDELITALFESMHDLHFLRDALDGGQFCLALATEVLPARAAIIHFFDVEKREWVVACTRGKDTSRLLTLRTPESDELLRDAARRRRAVVTPNGATAGAQRYQTLGGSRSMIIAPIMQAGRALGALEIINPLDGMPFTEDEGNAMTYIAEQYAEYLGSRGIVLDRERIQNAATPR